MSAVRASPADTSPSLQTIGPYRIGAKLGEGAFGTVYLVEQLAAAFSQRWTALKRHRELDQ